MSTRYYRSRSPGIFAARHGEAAALDVAARARELDRELCAELAISPVTATKWRRQASGPPFIKIGRLVRYRPADLDAWLASRTIGKVA
jgi:predicted DNA-binding transcriptional regulator AlpA